MMSDSHSTVFHPFNPSSIHPPHSDDDIDEAFNSADARIYFGPVTSPEKKIAAALGASTLSPARSTPLRRSPRLSTVPETPPVTDGEAGDDAADEERDEESDESRQEERAIGQEEENPVESRAATPENDFMQDEPSSVLASRIMRAHDNPSPPPGSPDFTSRHLDVPNMSISHSPSPEPFAPLIPGLESISSVLFSTPPGQTSLARPLQRGSDSSQAPLISFDSLSPSTAHVPVAPSTPTQSRSPPALMILDQSLSIDVPPMSPNALAQLNTPNLLAPSPVPADPPTPRTPDAAEEQAVVDALIEPSDNAEPLDDAGSTNPVQNVERISPRRSSRPRRSTAAYSSPMRSPSPRVSENRGQSSGSSSTKRKNGQRRSPRKSISLVPYVAEMPDPSTLLDRPRSRSRSRSPTRNPVFASNTRRELGSLSPSSVTILSSLLPTTASPLKEVSEPDPEPEPEPESGPESHDTPIDSTTPSTPPLHPAPPIRFSSPTKKASPNKFSLHLTDPDDPNRTPARRIPIQAAVASGQISPQKGARILSSARSTGTGTGTGPKSSSLNAPILNIPPTDSPARRVLLHGSGSASVSSPSKRAALSSPIRSRSVEPKPAMETFQLKRRGESVEPVLSKTTGKSTTTRPSPFSRSNSVDRIPFPLTAGISHQTSIPEESLSSSAGSENQDASALQNASVPSGSVPRSRLKQPTSKIPRIGLKPYARPGTSAPPNPKGQEKLSGMRRVDWSTPSESTSSKSKQPPPSTAAHPSRPNPPLTYSALSPVKSRVLAPSTPTSLKRKRGPESSSPSKSTPVVMLPALKRHLPSGAPSSPVKKPVLAQMRKVSDKDGSIPSRSLPSSSGSGTLSNSQKDKVVTSSIPESVPTPLATSAPASVSTPASESEPTASVVIPSPRPLAIVETRHPSPLRNEVLSEPPQTLPTDESTTTSVQPRAPSHLETSEFTFRRSTRSSRNSNVGVKAESSRPPPARRKNVVPVFQDTGPFSNMSAVALRALTNSNTERNQTYLTANLQTEVVRRTGARPDSPGMNVKTVLQKEKEAKLKDRSERAERRAKQESTGENDENEESEEDGSSGVESSPSSRKHTKGAGDEEDYTTPLQPAKRLRLGENVDEAEEVDDKKRVKWDRGLYREIYLEDIQPRSTHVRVAQESIKKGCLAPTAKALRLDTLGNLPNAESPLKDLVQESVVVKKFVYDSDVEPVAPTPTPAPVVKTRSKSKKSKS